MIIYTADIVQQELEMTSTYNPIPLHWYNKKYKKKFHTYERRKNIFNVVIWMLYTWRTGTSQVKEKLKLGGREEYPFNAPFCFFMFLVLLTETTPKALQTRVFYCILLSSQR